LTNSNKTKRGFNVTTLLSVLGLLFVLASIWQEDIISKQQQTIRGFETLLTYSSNQLDTLAKLSRDLNDELKLLGKQLAIAEETQKESNNYARIARRANANKLYLASTSLLFGVDILNVPADSAARWNTYTYFKNILCSQMDNPYLFENKVLSDNWTNCVDIISVQENTDTKFHSFHSKYLKSIWGTWVRRINDVAADALEYSLKEINNKE
jgi:hypothetical protein